MTRIFAALVLCLGSGGVIGGCASAARTSCANGTELRRRFYAGGGEAEWCRRPDGVREGAESRYYESGALLLTGEFRDGAQHGIWRFRFNDGRSWRAERWEDGELVAATVDPAVAGMSPRELAARGPMTSGVIKLASRDARTADERGRVPVVRHYPNGRPQLAGAYDTDGLRSGLWRWWYEDGRPAREIEFRGGLRDGVARAWHPDGRPAVEGAYQAGERIGPWRTWAASGVMLRAR